MKKSNKNQRVYLDYAAATPTAKEVLTGMNEALNDFANPSGLYDSALHAKQLLENSRKKCALFLQCNSDEIVFTSGSTESNNIAILGGVARFKTGRIISISTEHASVYQPLMQLKKQGFEIKFAKVDKFGQIDINHLASLLTKDTRLVTLSYANGEYGTIQPVIKIGQLIKAFNASRNSGILFHTDATAAALVLSCDVSRLGVDLLSLGGAKTYGPHGIGLLYARRNCGVLPIQFGGQQEVGLRAGTQPVFLASGLSTALDLIKSSRKADSVQFKKLHDKLFNELDKSGLTYIYNGHPKDRLFNVVSLILPAEFGDDMVAKLNVAGFEVATGAACEASSDKPSRALMGIGLSVSQAQSSLRVSFGRATRLRDIVSLVGSLVDIINS